MIAEKKASSDNDRFVEPDVFGPSTIEGWGDSEGAGVYAEAKIQELAKRKMRSGQPELATGNGDCSRKSKAFRSEMAARWILEAIVCEVCQPVRNLPVGAPVMPVGDGLGGLIRIARSPNTMFRVGIEK
jgi:hypothetical protein